MAITEPVAERLALMLAYMKDEGCTRSELCEIFGGRADSTYQTGLKNKLLCKGELVQSHKRTGTCAKRMYEITEAGKVWLEDIVAKNGRVRKAIGVLKTGLYSRSEVTLFGQVFPNPRTAIRVSLALIYDRALKEHDKICPNTYYDGNVFAEVISNTEELKAYFPAVSNLKDFLINRMEIAGLFFIRTSMGAWDDVKVSVGCWFAREVDALTQAYPDLNIEDVVRTLVSADPANDHLLKGMEYRLKTLKAKQQAMLEKQKKLEELVSKIGGMIDIVAQGKNSNKDLQNIVISFEEANNLLKAD